MTVRSSLPQVWFDTYWPMFREPLDCFVMSGQPEVYRLTPIQPTYVPVTDMDAVMVRQTCDLITLKFAVERSFDRDGERAPVYSVEPWGDVDRALIDEDTKTCAERAKAWSEIIAEMTAANRKPPGPDLIQNTIMAYTPYPK